MIYVKWLIIGTGWISEEFIANLRRLGEEPTVVYSRSAAKGKKFAERNNIKYVSTNLSDFSTEFENVYIGSPNAVHYKQAVKMIKMKKNVLVEKIMTDSYARTQKLFKLARKHKVKLMEAFVHITNPITDDINARTLKTNMMQISSKVKNGTYKTASTFNKNMFGGAIPDLGVYPLALSIKILGKITWFKMNEIKFLNGVESEVNINSIHENGISQFRVSKVRDGDNAVYIDGEKMFDHVSLGNQKWRMVDEIKLFNSNYWSRYEWVSLEVSRVVDQMKKIINKGIK